LLTRYRYRAVGNGLRTDHPIPDLPFVDDSRLDLDDPDAIEALGRGAGEGRWGRTDACAGGWVAFTTDPDRDDLGWIVRWHPEHGRSVVLYGNEEVASAYAAYQDEALLFRSGGYWWDGITWNRPSLLVDMARGTYITRSVPNPLTISAADLLADNADPGRGKVFTIAEVDADALYPAGGRWLDDLALWAQRHQGRHLAGCVVRVMAAELAADQLIGVPELAERAGIAAPTLRAYMTRGEADVPLPQAVVSRRAMWSRPVGDDWIEARSRSYEGIRATVSDQGDLPVGVGQLWQRLTDMFAQVLDRPAYRGRFLRRWRTADALRELAHTLGWSVAGGLNSIVPTMDLGVTIRMAVVGEWGVWQRQHGAEEHGYPITRPVATTLDWLIRHDPALASAVVAEIAGEAERELGIPVEISGLSVHRALALDGALPDGAYSKFMALALPPAS